MYFFIGFIDNFDNLPDGELLLSENEEVEDPSIAAIEQLSEEEEDAQSPEQRGDGPDTVWHWKQNANVYIIEFRFKDRRAPGLVNDSWVSTRQLRRFGTHCQLKRNGRSSTIEARNRLEKFSLRKVYRKGPNGQLRRRHFYAVDVGVDTYVNVGLQEVVTLVIDIEDKLIIYLKEVEHDGKQVLAFFTSAHSISPIEMSLLRKFYAQEVNFPVYRDENDRLCCSFRGKVYVAYDGNRFRCSCRACKTYIYIAVFDLSLWFHAYPHDAEHSHNPNYE